MTKKNALLLVTVTALTCLAAGYSIGSWHTDTNAAAELISNPSGYPAPVSDGSMLYTSDDYGFTLTYPKALGEVSDTDEGNGARTLVFQDPSGDVGFQIYIQPYTSDVITEEQFRTDNPTGIMIDPVDVLIDGIRATIFYSNIEGFGESREVWFIHKGYLYEVVTYKHLDNWLAEIMKSWKFS